MKLIVKTFLKKELKNRVLCDASPKGKHFNIISKLEHDCNVKM